jgi:hypothetical protein
MKSSAVLAACVALGCRAASEPPPHQAGAGEATGPIIQRFVCERSYMNFAYGYQHAGIFVDRDGAIHSFHVERSIPPQPPAAPDRTEAEMKDKYGMARKLVGSVPADRLRAMFQLIPAAARGSFSRRVQAGADRGAVVSSCYLFDAAAQRYREIELTVAGDWEYRNLAPEARILATWLESLGGPS